MNSQSFFNRTIIVVAVFFFTFGLAWFKLFQLQVVDYRLYAQASQEQSTTQNPLFAQRGRIYATSINEDLFPLALSEWRYQLLVSPRQVKDKRALARGIAAIISSIDEQEIFQKISNDKVYIPPLSKNLSLAEAQEIKAKNFGGVFLEPSTLRVYPEADKIAAQIVGFVGADGVGKSGVEGYRNSYLAGHTGKESAKKDSLGRLIAFLNKEQSRDGRDVILTIDYNAQYFIENKLREALDRFRAGSGSIIAMDPSNGEVIAMASQPTFDPNTFYQLKGDEQSRFNSAVIANTYEVGSVMKPLIIAGALEEKKVNTETKGIFGKSVIVAGKEITNVDNKSYGQQTLAQILENSDNVAMVWVGSQLGKEKTIEYLEKFGFSQKTNIDLIGEQFRQFPLSKDWNPLLQATVTFGQGIGLTPLQLAVAYSSLANGGEMIWPHVTKYLSDNSGRKEAIEIPKKKRILSTETTQQITEMLVGVVEKGHGKKARVDGIKVAGKTGTAQVAKPEGGYYEDRHTGTFAGYFPANNPKIVMVVRLDNPKTVKYAESSAAPVFGEIAQWFTNYYQLR